MIFRYFRHPRSPLTVLAGLALVMLLAGCWVPERYIARIKLDRDGSYKVYVEGTAVHPVVYRAVRNLEAEIIRGKLKPEEVKKRQADVLAPLDKELEGLKDDKRILGVSSLGDGRVRFTLSGTWSIERRAIVFSELQAPFAYSIAPDGTIRLKLKDAAPSREAQGLGMATEGDISIVVAEGIEVLEHNAQNSPTSPRGAYRWHIENGATLVPYLKVRLPAAGEQSKDQAGKDQQNVEHKGKEPLGKEPKKGAHK